MHALGWVHTIYAVFPGIGISAGKGGAMHPDYRMNFCLPLAGW